MAQLCISLSFVVTHSALVLKAGLDWPITQMLGGLQEDSTKDPKLNQQLVAPLSSVVVVVSPSLDPCRATKHGSRSRRRPRIAAEHVFCVGQRLLRRTTATANLRHAAVGDRRDVKSADSADQPRATPPASDAARPLAALLVIRARPRRADETRRMTIPTGLRLVRRVAAPKWKKS